MSSLNEIIQNLDSRVGALESEGLDQSAVLTHISKLYADIEIQVTWKVWTHRYRRCGDTQPLYGAVCGSSTYL